MRKLIVMAGLLMGLLLLAPMGADAHPERTTFFPDHTKGERPTFRTTGPAILVCKADSAQRIRSIFADNDAMRAVRLKQFARCMGSERRLTKAEVRRAKRRASRRAGRRAARRAERRDASRSQKRKAVKRAKARAGKKAARRARARRVRTGGKGVRHLQAAVDRASTGSRILILPGLYREEPSRAVTFNDPRCPIDDPKYWEPTNDGHGENGKVPTYQFHVDCKNSRNLVQILGDSPADEDLACDQKCDLQIEGLGRKPDDVLFEGDRLKRDVIRADRADGVFIKGLATEQASFNGVDIVETNGFVVDDVEARYNQNYGVLTFTSDNGLYQRVVGHHNGDSGIYPGSGPEGGCERFGIEIRNSESYKNVLGLSGTAGNGTWTHDTKFHDNAAGVINDSFASGHPGMPQDCSKWTDNDVYSNNYNPFEDSNEANCKGEFADRPRELVCPQFQVPVGSGFAFYGANRNIYENNRVWDNWRSGYRLFWVPGAIRGDNSPAAQLDTSNGNKIYGNSFGIAPDGREDPNGEDIFWDEQGVANCWQDNDAFGEANITSDPIVLPDCRSGGSKSPQGNTAKIAQEATCATWNPKTNPDPPGCTWFTTPPEPQPGRTRLPVTTPIVPSGTGGGTMWTGDVGHNPGQRWMSVVSRVDLR